MSRLASVVILQGWTHGTIIYDRCEEYTEKTRWGSCVDDASETLQSSKSKLFFFCK